MLKIGNEGYLGYEIGNVNFYVKFKLKRDICVFFVWIGFQSKFQILWRIKNKSEGLLKSKMCHYHDHVSILTKEAHLS